MRTHAQRLVHLSKKVKNQRFPLCETRECINFICTIHKYSVCPTSPNEAVQLNDYVAAITRAPIRSREIESTALVEAEFDNMHE